MQTNTGMTGSLLIQDDQYASNFLRSLHESDNNFNTNEGARVTTEETQTIERVKRTSITNNDNKERLKKYLSGRTSKHEEPTVQEVPEVIEVESEARSKGPQSDTKEARPIRRNNSFASWRRNKADAKKSLVVSGIPEITGN